MDIMRKTSEYFKQLYVPRIHSMDETDQVIENRNY